MTYTNVYRILEGDAAMRSQYAALVDRFELMRDLALILNRKRTKRGSIDSTCRKRISNWIRPGR